MSEEAARKARALACWRGLDGLRPRESPLARGRRSVRGFARGAGIAGGLLAAVVGALALAGAYDLTPRSCAAGPLLRFALGSGAFVLLAALFEELLFRGYALFALRDLAGPWVASAATGLLFAAGHQANPGFGPLALLNLSLVGAILASLARWYTPAEALIMATSTNAELLELSGKRNPYPGKLGVVEQGALADLLLVDGNPLENIELVADPAKNFKIIMKDGVIYKSALN